MMAAETLTLIFAITLRTDNHMRDVHFSTYYPNPLSSSLLVGNSKPAGAACLGGDIRAECIGIYKIPIDGMESKYVETPEMLKLYAPDIKWVPPTVYPPNYADALNQLKQQRPQLDIAQSFVAKGDLENAGLVILDIIPKVKAACIVMITAFGKASNNERNAAMKRKNKVIGNDGNPSSTPLVIDLEMKAYRIDDALNELMGCLGEIDILIGQGMRGDLGALTPAQIEILSNFPDCRREFDALLRAVPEKVSS